MPLPTRVSVVGAALLRDERVLASRRTAPPHLAGFWEFPGGKVEDGESDVVALARELVEELGVTATIGGRLGGDLLIGDTAVLRVYLCTDMVGEPQLVDHDAHRWLSVDELDDVPWIPVDAPLVEELRQLLGISRTGPSGGADIAGPG
ncbi:MAG: 8-oxo-dGTP diphosphatase [Frankiales bacterium]|nr:8-oxo-dGTP diphosphatase [Frankiales bacterium]